MFVTSKGVCHEFLVLLQNLKNKIESNNGSVLFKITPLLYKNSIHNLWLSMAMMEANYILKILGQLFQVNHLYCRKLTIQGRS